MPKATCSLDGCERPVLARAMCAKHYQRWAKEQGPLRPRRPAAERFASSFRVAESGCWEWTALRTQKGYGTFFANGRRYFAHVYSYETSVGPVPEGLELDHLCRVRHCVNPAHLEPVTHAENCRRGIGGPLQAAKTHCPYGHPYDAENTYHDGRQRVCRECARRRHREWYAKNRTKET